MDNRKSKGNTTGQHGTRMIWIILILTLGLLMLATTVMALDGPNEAPQPAASEPFDSAEALEAIRGIVAVDAAVPIPLPNTDLGCIQEFANQFGVGEVDGKKELNCTANDSQLGTTEVVGNPICTEYGADINVTFIVSTTSTAAFRYDVGVYFSTDGDPNGDGAFTGECAQGNLPTTPSPFASYEPDPEDNLFCVSSNGATANPAVDTVPCTKVGAVGDAQCAAQTIQPTKDFCEDSSDATDTCGDIQQGITYPMQFNVTAKCIDEDGNGFLDLPFCTSYDNQSGNLCTSALGATPNTVSKCTCNDDFELPIIVPPRVYLTKTASIQDVAPGGTTVFVIEYGNIGPGQTVTNLVISDTLHSDLKPVAIDGIPAPTSCTVDSIGVPSDGSAIGPDYYGGVVECAMPDLLEDENGVLQIEVMVDPTATDRQDIPNTACIEGEGVNPAEDPPPVSACDDTTITTPVSVSYFEANPGANGTSFQWETATETGNAGFNIFVKTENGLEKVNDEIILSKVVDSLSPQKYSYEAATVSGDVFYIADVTLEDVSRMHGPFEIGEKHGQRQELERIDWPSVHIENDAMAAQRAAANKAAVNGQTLRIGPLDNGQELSSNNVNKVLGQQLTAAEAAVYPMVELKVSEDGIYRVTYEDAAAVAGSSLNGAPMSQLALTQKGSPVPLYISSSGAFGPGEYIDFYGEGVDTLYSGTNVYVLRVHDGLALRAGVDNARPQRKALPPNFYMETLEIENNSKYSYRASNGDPWYDKVMYTKSGTSFNRDIIVDNYVAAAPSTLEVEMWGVSNRIEGDDHHVEIAFNDKPVIDSIFDFQEVVRANAVVAAADVKNGSNTLSFNIPNDQGADYDMSALEGYRLTYPRSFAAVNGKLDFEAADDVFTVHGLDSKNIVVYRMNGDELTRVTQVKMRRSGGVYSARFIGSEADAAYFVSSESALPAPEMVLSGQMQDINGGTAELLIISHPNFISGLAPLVAQRQSEGLSVKVVNVEQIYRQYNGGIFDANAIKDYIEHAMARMGTKYVLLVGGDTRDYRDYTGNGSISFVPTLYAKTSDRIHMAPVDPLFTDVTGNNVPDAAIGRFPVHTVAELNAVVGKTLTYHARNDRNSAVFAADDGFESDGDSLIPGGWSVEKAYIGEGFDAARANLLAQMNAGVPVANFIGHSDTAIWTFDGLFNSADAAGLTNHGKPMVVTQWGCFNTYFVGEAYKTLGDNFMLNGSNGAAAVTGATTITKSSSEQKLGALMMPRMMTSGVRIGDAMQDAKVELNKNNSRTVDVLLGWTILGDPTLVVSQ